MPPASPNSCASPIDQNHFFLEAHAKLRPLDFATDGIFLCGTARYPATVAEARAQGLGAASRAGTVLFKDKLITSAIVAEINPDTCVGCQGCLEVCPYGAIQYLLKRAFVRSTPFFARVAGAVHRPARRRVSCSRASQPKQLLSQIRALAV